MSSCAQRRHQLLNLYHEAVRALSGRTLVRDALRAGLPWPQRPPFHVLALGKAAIDMTRGVIDSDSPASALVIHPDTQAPSGFPRHIRCLAGEHPLPGQGSFAAGRAALDYLATLPKGEPLLVLLSGGGSSLMEQPREGLAPDSLRRVHEWLLSSGLDIVDINRVRQGLSATKGGGLARQLGDRPARVLCLSDVPPSCPAALASGPFLPPLDGPMPALPDWIARFLVSPGDRPTPAVPHETLADATTLRERVAAMAADQGLAVHPVETWVEGEAVEQGQAMAERLLTGAPGLWLWTGESTVTLPARPGRGGRCQQLALSAAAALAGHEDCVFLACGSDGLDGPDGEAGAVVDGATVSRGQAAGLSVSEALAQADAGRFLAAAGDLVHTGPSGTNLNDLMMGLKWLQD